MSAFVGGGEHHPVLLEEHAGSTKMFWEVGSVGGRIEGALVDEEGDGDPIGFEVADEQIGVSASETEVHYAVSEHRVEWVGADVRCETVRLAT